MKTYPIIFSGLMVRALIEGRKTQTRRLVKRHHSRMKNMLTGPWGKQVPGDLLWVRETWADVNTDNGPAFAYRAGGLRFCLDDAYPVEYERYLGMQFTMWWGDLARGEPGHSWRSPLHMPRFVSRLTLEVADIRIQRLHEISDDDALAEGLAPGSCINEGHRMFQNPFAELEEGTGDWAYKLLWESLHGEGTWEDNPEVIALTFHVRHCNVNDLIK